MDNKIPNEFIKTLSLDEKKQGHNEWNFVKEKIQNLSTYEEVDETLSLLEDVEVLFQDRNMSKSTFNLDTTHLSFWLSIDENAKDPLQKIVFEEGAMYYRNKESQPIDVRITSSGLFQNS